jgi:SAM-dependent methyltransferase
MADIMSAPMQASTEQTMEHVPCFLCGADDPHVLYEARHGHEDGEDLIHKFRASGDELLIDRLVQCRQCSFQYINPRLRGDLILSSYSQGDDPAYVSQLAARERTFLRSLADIEKLTGGKGKLLDIGTAAGAFVAVARSKGWDAEGCEPNRWLAEWGSRHYGITIQPGSIFEQSYEAGTFDVITLWDVIEHTLNPREVLDRCRELLKPGGVLIVNYPDAGSWIARMLGRRWPFLTSVHLYYFDRGTIREMLTATGFKTETVKPHVQWLELDYILMRGAVVSEWISTTARSVVQRVGASRAQVPYWLGQTFVAARRTLFVVSAFFPEVAT